MLKKILMTTLATIMCVAPIQTKACGNVCPPKIDIWEEYTETDYNSVTFYYTGAKTCKNFVIYRISESGKLTQVNPSKVTITDDTITIKGLTIGNKYKFEIMGYHFQPNGNDDILFSKPEKTNTVIPKLQTVDNFRLVKGSSGSSKYELRWNTVNGANGYKVYRAASKKGGYKLVATTKNTYAKFDAKVDYSYRIRAYRKNSKGYHYSDNTYLLVKR